MLFITNHWGSGKQNYNEISPHVCQNGYYTKKKKKKEKKIASVDRDMNLEPLYTVGGKVELRINYGKEYTGS